MSRLLVLLILLSLWCSSSFAQEKTPASSDTEDRKAKMKEGKKDPGIVWVKDPADWRLGLGEPVYSGPQPGETLKGFSIASLTRSTGDERVDPVALAKGKPHFIIFIDDSDIYEGLGAWHRAVGSIAENSRTGLAASAVILGEGPTFEKHMAQTRSKHESFYRWLNLFFQVGYSRDGRDGPGAYGLNRNIVMTILIADAKGKVIYNFPFRETLQDGPDPHVLGALAEVVGEERETVESWFLKETEWSNWHKWLEKDKQMRAMKSLPEDAVQAEGSERK